MNLKKSSEDNLIKVIVYIVVLVYCCVFSSALKAAENNEDKNNENHCCEQHRQHTDHNHAHSDSHQHQNQHQHGHHHKAFHDGKLFEIGSCENGHCEIKLNEDGMVELWLVGGGNNTGASIRTSAEEIKFKCKLKNGLKNDEFDLILKAAPIELAEESIGDCSHFTGHHEKLAGKNIRFFANGKIYFKGKNIKVEIDY